MLATAGPLPVPDEQWAREVKWDGVRLVVAVTTSGLTARTRNGNEVSGSYPELEALVDQVAGRPMLLDAEVVVFDKAGRSDFSLIQTRMHVRRPAATLVAGTPVQLMIFDLLHLDDQSLLRATYDERRDHLTGLRLNGPSWQTPAAVEGDGATILAASREHGLEGIMSKRRTSSYEPGGRSKSWVKTKNIRRSSALVCGWKPGERGREGQIGSLLLGVHPAKGDPRLEYAGSVGTGFTQATLRRLETLLKPLQRNTSPFTTPVPRADAKDAVWTDPKLIAEVLSQESARGRSRQRSRRVGVALGGSDVVEFPAAVQVGLEGSVEAEVGEPVTSGDGLDPVGFLAGWCCRSEPEVDGSVGVGAQVMVA